MKFIEILPEKLIGNPYKLIGNDWMLITTGKPDNFNTMTASWGAMGVLWHRNVCFCFVRPTRYTYTFMEENDYFTLSFFNQEYKSILEFCGTKSGREVDKIKSTSLEPIWVERKYVYFKQATLTIACRKIYFQDLNPGHFLDIKIHESYSEHDYHRMYVGEIIKILMKESKTTS